MVDLLVVGLQDELAEGAAAVSVDLQGIKPSQLNIKKQALIFFLVIQHFTGEYFQTQGLMSPYLRASMTNFRQSPMS